MRGRLRDDRDETIERLRDELYVTRREMLHLMPDDISSLLDGYHRCESRQAAYVWEQGIVADLIQRVERPRAPGTWEEQRANCPLCNSGAMRVGDADVELVRILPGERDLPEALVEPE